MAIKIKILKFLLNKLFPGPISVELTAEKQYESLLRILASVEFSDIPQLFQHDRQKTLVGVFNKSSVKLPFAGNKIDFRLLGCSDSENNQSDIAKSLIKKFDQQKSKSYTSLIGQSGCGKTRTLFDVASRHYLMFMECITKEHERLEDTTDTNFSNMVEDIRNYYDNFSNTVFLQRAEERIKIELLARLLYLRGLFEKDKKVYLP